jgi:hypothetical protein
LQKLSGHFAEEKTFGGKSLRDLENFSAFAEAFGAFCRRKNFWRKVSQKFRELFRLYGKNQGKIFLFSANSTVLSENFFIFYFFRIISA